MSQKTIELAPIKESKSDFDIVEERLKEFFKREIYFPALRELGEPKNTIMNAKGDDALVEALRAGRVTFSRGTFSGKFNAQISKALKDIGASWDRKTDTFKVRFASLPREIREAVSVSEFRFQEKLDRIDVKLAKILPEEISERIKVADCFDRTLWKTDKAFQQSVKGITVAPQLTPERRKQIADEWQNNMKLWVKDFTEQQIVKMRKDLQKSAFAGNRYGAAVKTIQDSYKVSANKAKFLARQETSLLMTKFKQTRYEDAGVNEYKWGCVSGTKNHPVRPSHKRLEGKTFRWDDPPITTEVGQPVRHNNPGQDYNCRCFAKPIVRFTK